MARLQDLLNQDPNGYISMAELDAIEAAQRGQSIVPNLSDLAPGTGYIQRTGGERINVGQPNQAPQAQLDYASPLDVMGAKGYRIKGDPNRALLNDGRIVTLNAGDVAATQALRQKQEAAALDMDIKRADLASKQGGEWHIDSASGMMINKRSGEIKPIDGGHGGKAPAGYRWTSGGNMEPIPGGPADLKLTGQLNADTQALTGSTSSMDRLATAANEVLNHPGLAGIFGMQGAFPNVPGSNASDAAALLNTLKSQVGFGVLQDMRNNSKTGGALGAVSDKENAMLQSNLAALDSAQSIEQAKSSLQKIVDYSQGAKDRLREAYNLKHGNQPGAQASPGGPPRVASDADYNALPKGATYIDPNGNQRTKR